MFPLRLHASGTPQEYAGSRPSRTPGIRHFRLCPDAWGTFYDWRMKQADMPAYLELAHGSP